MFELEDWDYCFQIPKILLLTDKTKDISNTYLYDNFIKLYKLFVRLK